MTTANVDGLSWKEWVLLAFIDTYVFITFIEYSVLYLSIA